MSKAYNTRQDESLIMYHDEGKFASVCKTNCYFDSKVIKYRIVTEKGLFQLNMIENTRGQKDNRKVGENAEGSKTSHDIKTETGKYNKQKIQKYDNPICKAMSCFDRV